MKKSFLLCILFLVFISFEKCFATTWDEPWQDKVMKDAESFILGKVQENQGDSISKIKVIKTLSGKPVSGEIELYKFYDLLLCSWSAGEGANMHFKKNATYYFFIKANKNESYSIATPTSGYAFVDDDNKVYATYRHSYHQALLPQDIYEKSMTAIFMHYHNETYDADFVNSYVKKYLSIRPAGFEKEQFDTFCFQHAALEMVYHLQLPGYFEMIVPFLHFDNLHVQVSAARALSAYNTKECKAQLVNFIVNPDENISGFSKVMAIRSVKVLNPKEYKPQLDAYLDKASDKESGFGGNIMDPRVCTSIPTVKNALEDLLKSL